jgi:hypothetical protein
MLVEAVDDRAVAGQSRLELRQPLVDTANAAINTVPAGSDEIDEQGEIVDAGMALGEDVSFDPLETADGLVRQAANLGEVASARPEVLLQAVLNGLGQTGLEAGCGRGERLDCVPGALERRVERGRIGAACGRVLDPLLGAGYGLHVHEPEDRTRVGWTFPSSTTSCRRT